MPCQTTHSGENEVCACQMPTWHSSYLFTTAAGFLSSFTVSENSYVQSSVAAMHVHAAGSLILDCFVGSSHSSHVHITSNSVNHQFAQQWSSQSATGRQHWICTATSAATCCATLLPRRRVYLHATGNFTLLRVSHPLATAGGFC